MSDFVVCGDGNYARDLSGFTGAGYIKGRPVVIQAMWMLASSAVFMQWWCPSSVRVTILRWFGASIGENVLIRHGVRIHWPWKLSIGANSWLGEGAYILNLEPVFIGDNVCISQQALLCTGSHDRRSPTFEFDNSPITVLEGAWIAARAVVLRGVTVGEGATVGAGVVVHKDIPARSVVVI